MLQVKDLKKFFGGVKAVNGVSFGVRKEEQIAIVGPNGAGKTTLLNLISGFLKPTEGVIIYNGIDIVRKSVFERIKLGIVRSWQIPQLFESLSVREAIFASLLSKRGDIYKIWKYTTSYKDELKKADEIASLFNLKEDKKIKELSEGERKLLDVALAFALKPNLLLLDEPTSGVSSEDKFKVISSIIEACSKEKITLLVVEHDMEIIKKYFGRVIFMHEGRILKDSTPNDVFNDEIIKNLLGE
ncbi:MAG: ABC transporter ATP-binding protein [Thermoprotei archaeon]